MTGYLLTSSVEAVGRTFLAAAGGHGAAGLLRDAPDPNVAGLAVVAVLLVGVVAGALVSLRALKSERRSARYQSPRSDVRAA